MKVKELIEKLQQYDKDANVYVTTTDNYSYSEMEITSDDDEDMGNDVYITGYDL